MIIERLLENLPEDSRPLFSSMYNEILRLQEQNAFLRRQLFGSQSERYIALPPIFPKGTIFNEAEAEAAKPEITENGEGKNDEEKSGTKKKSTRSPDSGGRNPLPENLPREQVVHDLPEDKKICQTDLTPLIRIGEDIVEKLELKPAQLIVIQHIYPKYACSVCDTNVIRVPAEASILPKAQCEPGLLAEIIIAKYLMAIPLYRQETSFKQMGISLSRTSLARWIIGSADALQPLLGLIKKFILSRGCIHADETTIQVLKGTGKSPKAKNYMWAICSGSYDPPAVWFEFHASRSQEAAKLLLQDFKGGLHVDGYGGYNFVNRSPDITRIGCWAHARRAFDSAIKDGAPTGHTIANLFMDEIKTLFLLEREWKDLDADQRQAKRQEQSSPVVQRIRNLLDENTPKVPPKAKLASAMGYLANDWETFTAFLGDGRFELSNNNMENHIRPFAIGRKNWLFADTVAGARASADIYSLVVSARANGLDVRQYFTRLLTDLPLRLACNPEADLTDLLPWNWTPPTQPPDSSIANKQC